MVESLPEYNVTFKIRTHFAECLSRYVLEGAPPAGVTVGTHARWYVNTAVNILLIKL